MFRVVRTVYDSNGGECWGIHREVDGIVEREPVVVDGYSSEQLQTVVEQMYDAFELPEVVLEDG